LIYFMQAVGGGPIKIGKANDVARRRDQLQRFYACDLRVLGTVEGDSDRERELHAQFGHLRIARTEQFQPGPEIYEFLGLPCPGEQQVQAMSGNHDRVSRPVSTNMRSRPDYKEWMNEFAGACGTTINGLVEEAMLLYAYRQGFSMPPKM